MKKYLAIAVMILGSSLGAMCWTCNTPGQIRIQVPTGTIGNGTGDGSGQVVVDSGLTFECETLPTSAPTSASNTNTNTNSNAANSVSTSGATSGSTSSATGGKAVATGGSVGPITNTLTNTNTLQQTQKQQQSNSSTNNNASTATSNGDNSNNSTEVTNIKPAAASAVAPIGFPTAPCLGTFGGAAQSIPGGISFGGSKVDQGCDSRATAQQFALLLNNRVAAAKILCTTKAARRAHLTMEDCLAFIPAPVAVVPPVVIAPPVAQPEPVQVSVYFETAPVPQVVPTVAPKPLGDVKPRSAKHIAKPCKITPALQQSMEK